MSNIKRQADGVWRARYRDAAGKEHARHFSRKVDAQRWLDEVTSSVVTGTYTDPALSKVTVGEWGRRWLDGHAALKPSTRFRYESLMRVHIEPRWGTTSIRAVNVADVERWLAEMTAKGLAASSVRQAYRVLSLILDHAVRAGRLPRNPAGGASLPKAQAKDKRFLTTPRSSGWPTRPGTTASSSRCSRSPASASVSSPRCGWGGWSCSAGASRSPSRSPR